MANTKTKRTRPRKAGNTPIPHGSGSVCGHSGCGSGCNVRYSGPTSHPRDHLIHQAARGARHVWLAAIVAGFAVVLTGAIAFSAVQAETQLQNWNSDREVTSDLSRRLERMEKKLDSINAQIWIMQHGEENSGQE